MVRHGAHTVAHCFSRRRLGYYGYYSVVVKGATILMRHTVMTTM